MVTEPAVMRERDDDTGRYTSEHPDSAFFEAIEALGGDGGTQEIADEVGCEYDAAYKKLRRLEERGEIQSRKIANARLWSVPHADE